LRLPPVKVMRRGEPVKDVWRIILANHRTPDAFVG
jgi:N-methylhydantoinase B/oxoprolinase/acetone carboxylase alpha subunit